MHQITDTISAVVVPVEATDVHIEAEDMYYKSDFAYFEGIRRIKPLWGKYNLVGEITHESISFDCEAYVEKDEDQLIHKYRYYINKGQRTHDKDVSFRSLLQSKGLYWDNPYGKKYPWVYDEDAGTERESLAHNWSAAEASKLTKEQKLIIIEKQ